ncbi:MAG TPA: drug/metabolite exporter YedA [Longimicrobiales bacterium]
MLEATEAAAPSRARVLAAFAAVYMIWGSTYLAIRFAIETLPPFLMAGVRFLVAGVVMYVWVRLRGAPRPTRAEWMAATVIGALLLLGGNGAVVWAEQRVPSGVASLLVAIVPVWMVLLEWLRPGGTRPTLGVTAGLVVGFAGLALLVGPGEFGGGAVDTVGAGVLVLGSLTWAVGSIYSRGAKLPSAPLLGTAMEMLAGGALLILAGLLTGEGSRLTLDAVTPRSVLALLYLIGFGSLIGYTAYVWLLKVSTPARASTYAYVNPVVAVFLGWVLADEPLTPRVLAAAAVIIGAVAVITTAGSGGREPARRRSRLAPNASGEQAA